MALTNMGLVLSRALDKLDEARDCRNIPRWNRVPRSGPERLPRRGTTAVDRGADLLLRVLEAERAGQRDRAGARRAGSRRAPPRGCSSALERHGLVEQDGERGRLRPGPAILRVAERGMLERNIVELARPIARRAVAGERRDDQPRGPRPLPASSTSRRSRARHFLGAGQWLGRAVEYHCSANGKVFLAFGRAPLPGAAADARTRTAR